MKLEKPLRVLPEGYQLILRKTYGHRRTFFNRNLLGFLLCTSLVFGLDIVFKLIFPKFTSSMLAYLTNSLLEIGLGLRICFILVSILFVIGVHILIHAISFWVVLANKPSLSFSNWTRHVAPPHWFYPKRTFIYASLAPLLLPTILGFVIMPFIPKPFVLWIFISMGVNGLISGDLIQKVFWSFPHSSKAYIRDSGDTMYFFEL